MNWGNKLLVGFLVFAGGMSFLVYRSVKTNYELVEKDYYKNEITYQQVIDGTERAQKLNTPVQLVQEGDQVKISFPGELQGKEIEGTILFYCAYNQQHDRSYPVKLKDTLNKNIPVKELYPGAYTVKIDWSSEGRGYHVQQAFDVH